jgi:hypothetical protein
MDTLRTKNNSQKNYCVTKNVAMQRVWEYLSHVKKHRVGDDYALNYDPRLISDFDRMIEFADTLDLSGVPPADVLDSVYGHMIMAYHMTGGMLPPSPLMKSWLDKNLEIVAPEFVETYKRISTYESFHPLDVTEVKFDGFIDVPPSATYDVPVVDPDIIIALAQVENNMPYLTTTPLVGYSNGVDGRPIRNVTAQDLRGVCEANKKFDDYRRVDDDVNFNDLYLCSMDIVRALGEDGEYDPEFVESLADSDGLISGIDKDSSMGYTNLKFFDEEDGVVRNVSNPRKRDAIPAQVDNFEMYKSEMNAYLLGLREDIPYPGPLFEAHKLEILTHLEYWDTCEEYVSADEVNKGKMKQRLFYMSASLALMADNVVFKTLVNTMRYWMSAIGIKTTEGGLLEMWDIVLGKRTSPLKQRWRRVERWAWHKHGVDLKKRRYGEGDWSSYDTTLVAMVMAAAIGTAFSIFSKTGDPLIRLLAITCHGLAITKVMYMYLADQFYRVQGRMFSGVLITSTIDTVYQIVLFLYYCKMLLKKFSDNELLREVVAAQMFIMFFYGDDHIAGWPVWMEQFKLEDGAKDTLDDFVMMCVSKFGMKYKTSASQRYEDGEVIGEIHFMTSEYDGVPLEVPSLTRLGCSFLKYTLVQIHFDKQPFLTPIPMKHPKDATAKCGWSVNASKNVSLEMAKVVALAFLNTNPEVHVFLEAYHDALSKRGAVLTPEVMDSILAHPDGISMYLLAQVYNKEVELKFPSLLDNFKKQYDGYRRRTGFQPLDKRGRIKLDDRKRKMWRADDYTGSAIPIEFE